MSEVAGARPERRTEENDSWAATALCVVCESYEGAREEQRLTGAREQMAGIARRLRDLKFHVQVIGEDGDPDLATFQRKKEDWRAFWRHEGGNGPALVLWSGHGLLDGADLRLVLHDLDLTGNPSERKMRLRDQCVTTQSLVDTAMASGADQVLLVVDACHAGAGLVQSVEVALDHLERTSLPEGRAKWLGAVASCRSGELSQGYGPLVQAVSAILDHGPDGDYRAAWSVHNKQISGQDLLDAVWTRWDEDGQEPVAVTVGREERPAFPNPRSVPGAPPALVEHLVLAARGVGHREEGWFFTGRRHVLGRIVEWMGAAAPGLFLVTGPAGCGKSAVLGRIATLADPEQRERTIRQGALREGDPDPGVRKPRTFAAVHLRGMDPAQAAAELAVQLGLDEPENVDAFKAGLRRLPAPPVVVLDGLDEVPAEHTQRMVEELVFPLSRLAPVLVGSRERPFRSRLADGETLPQALARHVGDGVVIFDLEKDEPDTRKDIADYIRLRCEAAEVNGAEVVEALADRATEEDGGFLFARLVTGFLIGRLRDGATSGPELLAGLPDSVQAAFEEDLRSGPVRMRDGGATLPSAARDLLTALAWAAGRGMPAGGVWEAVASALGSESGGGGDDAGVVYDEGDVDWLLSHYGRYIVEDGEGSQAVYRLYHREFMTYLRGRPGPGGKAAEVSVLETLTNLVRRQGVVGDWGAVDPYVREWIATHAVWAGGPGIEVMRGLVGWDRESALPHLGTALHDLAVDLSRRGNREAAAEMSREAAEVYGALTDEDAAAHTPHMANALNTLAVCLAETGERQAALEPAHEAVRIRRELAQTNPAAHLPDLAMALNTLAIRLAETGDRQAALEPAHEAAHLYTQLAQTNPTAHLPNLATSLNNLANRLAETGDRQAALEPAHEAVRIRRELAQTNPAAHLPDLAMALNNLANRLAETGNRQAALEPAHEAAHLYTQLAQTNPTAYLPNLAGSLNNLANRLAETGNRQAALEPAHEAVRIRRELAQTNPAAYLPDLAGSLNNLAVCLAETGDRQAALEPAHEAAHLYTQLAQTNPAAHLPDLAMALNNLANRLAETGNRQAALEPAHEAAHLYTQLAQTNPTAYLPNLAGSLNNLANRLAETGNRQAALEPAHEAVRIRRELAQTNPAAYLPDLAGSLNNLAVCLAETGDRQAALEPAHEAAHLYTQLAQTNPAAHLPDLAMALNNLANRLAETGDPQAALEPAHEAAHLYTQLAQTNPAAYLPDLAMALNNLANRLAETGDPQAALEPAHEAVRIRRELAQTNPAAYLPNLAGSLNNLANRLAETGNRQAALEPAHEAAHLYTQLAQTNPAAYLPDLAMALNNLANRLAETGDPQAALEPAHEAVRIRRELAQTNPAAYLPNLAGSLNNLANRLAETGNRQAALEPAHEAVRIRRELAQTNPAAYLPDLAMALNNLANQLAATGNDAAAIRVYTHTASNIAQTNPAARRFLDYERAAFQISRPNTTLQSVGLQSLIALLNSDPTNEPDGITFRTRMALRSFARESIESHSLLGQTWRQHTPDPLPAWLSLPDETLDLVAAWMNTPTWQESQDFWTRHTDGLSTKAASTALAEFALITPAAEQHQRLRQRILSEGPAPVFRDLILRDQITNWLECENWQDSQRFLEESPDLLADDSAEAILATIAPHTPEIASHAALLHMSRTEHVDTAYRRVQDREALQQYVLNAIAGGDAEALLHASAIERAAFNDNLAALTHFHAALLLSNASERPAPDDLAEAAAEADPETRNRLVSELVTPSARPGQQPARWLPLIQALTQPRPQRHSDGPPQSDDPQPGA